MTNMKEQISIIEALQELKELDEELTGMTYEDARDGYNGPIDCYKNICVGDTIECDGKEYRVLKLKAQHYNYGICLRIEGKLEVLKGNNAGQIIWDDTGHYDSILSKAKKINESLEKLNESFFTNFYNRNNYSFSFNIVGWDVGYYGECYATVAIEDKHNNKIYCRVYGPSGEDLNSNPSMGAKVTLYPRGELDDVKVWLDDEEDALWINNDSSFYRLKENYKPIFLQDESQICNALHLDPEEDYFELDELKERLKEYVYKPYLEKLKDMAVDNWEEFIWESDSY